MNLLEYCRHYVQARDAFERRLQRIEERSDALVCTYKDRVVTFVAQERLSPDVPAGVVTVVTLQTPENFETLVRRFAEFSANPGLTIFFVNPKLSEKWLLKPAVHAAVADKSTLRAGLLALYQTVPAV